MLLWRREPITFVLMLPGSEAAVGEEVTEHPSGSAGIAVNEVGCARRTDGLTSWVTLRGDTLVAKHQSLRGRCLSSTLNITVALPHDYRSWLKKSR